MSFAWHVIRDHLVQSTSTLNFQRSFDTMLRLHDTIEPFRDPAGLLDSLRSRRGDLDQKNLILTALVSAAQGDGPTSDCAVTILLLALWPGMDAARRRSIGRRMGAADEIASDLLARTTETIRGLDLGRVNRIAATILRNVERDMIRARQREVERESAGSDIDPDDLPARLSAADDTHLHDDLRTMIGTDAALVTRVAMHGYSQAEVAVEMGLTEAATRKRYQRATRRLRELLQEFA